MSYNLIKYQMNSLSMTKGIIFFLGQDVFVCFSIVISSKSIWIFKLIMNAMKLIDIVENRLISEVKRGEAWRNQAMCSWNIHLIEWEIFNKSKYSQRFVNPMIEISVSLNVCVKR